MPIRNDYHDTRSKLHHSKLPDKKEYKYSDFTFIILKEYLEKVTGKSISKWFKSTNFMSREWIIQHTIRCRNLIDLLHQLKLTRISEIRYCKVMFMIWGAANGRRIDAGIFFPTSWILPKWCKRSEQRKSMVASWHFTNATLIHLILIIFCAEGNRRGLGFWQPQQGARTNLRSRF
jgi:hypothetical protein